jgi:hypothetical protein
VFFRARAGGYSVASETLVLDPPAIATGRTQYDLTPYMRGEGPDFGDSAVAAYMAEAARGEIPVDFRVPNRTVQIPLLLRGRTGKTFDTLRTEIQQKAVLLQHEGGWVGRSTSLGTLYAEVVNATLRMGGGNLQAAGLVDADATLSLEYVPEWYGDEVTLTTHNETTLPELVFTETGIKGAGFGRVRLVVTDTQGQDQLGLLWGFRCRNYSSASTARLAYEAEALTPMDLAATSALTGASGGGSNTIQHANLGTGWTPVLNTNLLAGTYLTHVGSYRVYARVYSTSGSAVQMRFVWDVGDMTFPEENDRWTFPDASQFYIADLGEIRLDPVPSGTHRWQGQIQAKGTGGESVRVDRLFFQPIDESAGRLRTPISTDPGLTAYSARDEFNQTAGALAGKTAAVGGAWAGAGDADDFQVSGSGTLTRTAVSDTTDVGRYAIIGSAMTNMVTQTDLSVSGYVDKLRMCVTARYTDTNNWLMARLETSSPNLSVRKRVGGTISELGYTNPPTLDAGASYTLRLLVTAAGLWFVWFYPQGSAPGDPTLSGQDSALATGGALASGKPTLYDEYTSAAAVTRTYDNFAAWPLSLDAVVFANRIAELRTDGMYRQDSAGGAYGPVSHVIGDLPRVPPAGYEARTLEVFLKSSRGDLDQLPDAGIDDQRATLNYRPVWPYVPGA